MKKIQDQDSSTSAPCLLGKIEIIKKSRRHYSKNMCSLWIIICYGAAS